MSQKGDVFSFSIILQEICTRMGPYEANDLDVHDILEKLINPDSSLMRPKIPENSFVPVLKTMMKSCWMENPEDRPCFKELGETFRNIRQKAGNTANIMDNLLQRMSHYADNLEQLAAERTKAYLEEKQKVEELLHRLLPKTVANQLQLGKPVSPEMFECVSIYFSDIVGFTTIASKSAPIEVIDLLNNLYTAFDGSIDKYCVYKVETIGDAYMCVSGLPERIGDKHVTEICDMSLDILRVVRGFKIRHMPRVSLQIRIGIHSGPAVAGVVGLTMPRYCLFGDTVNTASRMESTSESMKIQLSSSTKKLLEKYPKYFPEKRGDIEIKGKGLMTTYWLEEEDHMETYLGESTF